MFIYLFGDLTSVTIYDTRVKSTNMQTDTADASKSK